MGCFKIKITSSKGDSLREIEENSFTIGRSKKADIVIQEDSISREHILVSKVKDNIYITDMETANGTKVEDANIPSGAPYRYLDSKKIKLGKSDTVIKISFGNQNKDPDEKEDHVKNSSEDETISKVISIDKSESTATGLIAISEADRKIRENKIKQLKIEQEKALLESEQMTLRARKKAKQEGLTIKKSAEKKAQEILDKANLELEQFKAKKNEQQSDLKRKLEEVEAKKNQSLSEIKSLEEEVKEWKSKVKQEEEKLLDKQSEYKNIERNIESQKTKGHAEIEKKEAEFEVQMIKKKTTLEQTESDKVKAQRELESLLNEKKDLIQDSKKAEQRKIEMESYLENNKDSYEKLKSEIKNAQLDRNKLMEEIAQKKSSVFEEVEEIRKKALDKAEKERDEMLKEALTKKDTTLEEIQNNEQKLQDIKNEFKTLEEQSSSIVKDAREEALKIKDEIIKKNEHLVMSIQSEAEEKKKRVLEEVERLRQEELNKAQKERKRIILQSKEKKDAISKEIQEHEKLSVMAKGEVQSLQEQAAQIIENANKAGEEIKYAAQGQAELLVSKAKEQVMTMGKDAKDLGAKNQQKLQDIKKLEEQVKLKNQKMMEHAQKQIKDQKVFLEEQKKNMEKDIASIRARENEEIKKKRKEEERNNELKKEQHINEITQNIEAIMNGRIKDYLNTKTESPPLRAFPKEIKKIITEAFTNKSNAASLAALQKVMPVNNKNRNKSSRFWIKMGIRGSLVTGVAVILFIFPEIITKTKEKLSTVFTTKKSASNLYVEKMQKKRKNRPKFDPETTSEFKKSYTDNILYTTNYLKNQRDREYQKKWVLELDRFFVDELKLSENTIPKFIAVETSLINELEQLKKRINPTFVKKGIARMHQAEERVERKIKDLFLGSEKHYAKFQEFHRNFYTDYDFATP